MYCLLTLTLFKTGLVSQPCLIFYSFPSVFRFNLGRGKVIISTNFNLDFNQWYHVEIIRVGLQGTLIVNNDEYVFRGVAPGTWTDLNLKAAVVYLGGGTSFNGDLM